MIRRLDGASAPKTSEVASGVTPADGGVAPSRAKLRSPELTSTPEQAVTSSTQRRTAGGALALEATKDASTTEVLVAAGRLDEAVSRLAERVTDPGSTPSARAKAALQLGGLLVDRDPRPDRAELYLAEASRLDPASAGTPEAQRLRCAVRIGRGDARGAQALLHDLMAAAPGDPEVLVLAADVARLQMQPDRASNLAEQALDAVNAAAKPALAARIEFTLGYASFAAGRPHDAIRWCRQAFTRARGPGGNPQTASKACQILRELVCPDFESPDRPRVQELLRSAEAAYQASDWDQAQADATKILELEPNEALGFHLFAVAHQRRVEDRPLLAALDSPERRAALVQQFESVLAKAGAKPTRLFPDWPALNDVQRAKVAHSALLFADVLPGILSRKPARRIHLVPPGQSCTDRDPYTDRSAKHDAFGRHWYGTRGWVGRADVVVGLEDLDAAARGAYDTVTHELSHLVQFELQRRGLEQLGPRTQSALQKEGLVGDGPNSARDFNGALATLFRSARAGGRTRPVTDYAGTSVEEFFAESMMAYVNPEATAGPNAWRLFERDPRTWRVAQAIVEDLAEFPGEVGAPALPAAGMEAVGDLEALLRDPNPAIAAAAAALQASLLEDPGHGDEFRLRRSLADDLAQMSRGIVPLGTVGRPQSVIRRMSSAQIDAQIDLLISRGGDRAAELEALKGSAEGLDARRARLVELHDHMSMA